MPGLKQTGKWDRGRPLSIALLLSRQAKTFNRRVGRHKNELLASWLVFPISLCLSELRILEVKGFHQFDP